MSSSATLVCYHSFSAIVLRMGQLLERVNSNSSGTGRGATTVSKFIQHSFKNRRNPICGASPPVTWLQSLIKNVQG